MVLANIGFSLAIVECDIDSVTVDHSNYLTGVLMACAWLSQPRVEATRIRARHVTQARGHSRPATHQGVQVGVDSGSGYQPVK